MTDPAAVHAAITTAVGDNLTTGRIAELLKDLDTDRFLTNDQIDTDKVTAYATRVTAAFAQSTDDTDQTDRRKRGVQEGARRYHERHAHRLGGRVTNDKAKPGRAEAERRYGTGNHGADDAAAAWGQPR